MDNKKIDITSTALEKGIDAARDFLDKLIMPTVEETGLLLKDRVTMWRFKNQVRMLNKAKSYCEANKISPKTVSLKLLLPLLDNAGLEEDEVLQDKWAILLSNLVDSEQNIENHVFPYILSQLSSNEFLILEKVYDEKIERIKKLRAELADFLARKPKLEADLNDKIAELETQIKEAESKSKTKFHFNDEVWELQKQKRTHESELSTVRHNESTINYKIGRPATIPYDILKEYELSNVIRLGLVKEEKEFYARSQTLEIPYDRDYDRRYINVDLDIDVESDKDNILTELGELFIFACKEKNGR